MMKKTLLFTAALLVASTSLFAQNLIQNGSADEHTASTGDNADAFDMTPNSTIKDESNVDVDTPYLWSNPDLETYLSGVYASGGSVEEQPGSTSTGNNDTRGIKLYNDGDPVAYAVGVSTRRLYQEVAVTAGTTYTVSLDARASVAMGDTDVYILNEAITTEVGLENGTADSRVDGYLAVSNVDAEWQTVSFVFTATSNVAVFYLKSDDAYCDGKGTAPFDVKMETYFDNISIVEGGTASVKDNDFSTYFSLYPNPASDFINIVSKSVEVTGVQVYSVTGQLVIAQNGLGNGVDVSSLNKGIYILKLSSDDNQYSRKIIIE